MDYPKYPRELPTQERRAVIERAMRGELEKFALECAEAGTPVNDAIREEFETLYMRGCRDAWRDERIAELETQLAGAMKKISRLSKRLMAETER